MSVRAASVIGGGQEFRTCLGSFEELRQLSEAQAKTLFGVFDWNQNGWVDREEFCFVLATQASFCHN